MRKKLINILVLCFILTAIVPGAFAQDPGGTGFIPRQTDRAVPFDGGLAVLLAAGAGYGLKKYRSSRQRKPEVPTTGSPK